MKSTEAKPKSLAHQGGTRERQEPVARPPVDAVPTPVDQDSHHYDGRVDGFIESAMVGAERVLGVVRQLLSNPFRDKCRTAVLAHWPNLPKSAFRRQYEDLQPLKNEPSGTQLHREQVFMFHDMMETVAHEK